LANPRLLRVPADPPSARSLRSISAASSQIRSDGTRTQRRDPDPATRPGPGDGTGKPPAGPARKRTVGPRRWPRRVFRVRQPRSAPSGQVRLVEPCPLLTNILTCLPHPPTPPLLGTWRTEGPREVCHTLPRRPTSEPRILGRRWTGGASETPRHPHLTRRTHPRPTSRYTSVECSSPVSEACRRLSSPTLTKPTHMTLHTPLRKLQLRPAVRARPRQRLLHPPPHHLLPTQPGDRPLLRHHRHRVER
jgi:hypothetical protein